MGGVGGYEVGKQDNVFQDFPAPTRPYNWLAIVAA